MYSVPVFRIDLFGVGVFGDGLRTLRDSMFGQLTRKDQPDSGLDIPGGDCGSLIFVSQFGSLGSNTFKKIIDKGVHDAHGLAGDTGIGMDLLQHLVDVDSIRLFTLMFAFLAVFGNGLGGLS